MFEIAENTPRSQTSEVLATALIWITTTTLSHQAFIGGDIAGALLRTNAGIELHKAGFHGDLKGLYSLTWNTLVFDTGFGWLISDLNGERKAAPRIDENLRTQAGIFELTGRYKFSGNWQAGVQTNSLFGTEVEFGDPRGARHFSILAGPQLVYEWDFGFPVRATSSFLTDLTIGDRQIYLLSLGGQMGFDVIGLYDRLRNISTTESALLVPENRGDSLMLAKLLFEFDSPTPSKDSGAYLESLAGALNNNNDAWERLEINGYTDEVGGDDYNQRLSELRAAAIEAALVNYGMSSQKIHIQGFGKNNPSSDVDPGLNRRVEVVLKQFKKRIVSKIPILSAR